MAQKFIALFTQRLSVLWSAGLAPGARRVVSLPNPTRARQLDLLVREPARLGTIS